jgi:hypothetical protein
VGTFAEKANFDYRFLFADQGKQTRFPFPFAVNNRKLPFSV